MTELKPGDLVRIRNTLTGGLIDLICGDTAWLRMVARPGERVPMKLSELEPVE